MNDKPVIRTPGETLAGLRKAAARSLDELAEATKIPLPMLQAIELDEYHKISGDLYVKSFLRSYATEVGMDVEEVLELYASFTGTPSAPDGDNPANVWHEEEVQVKRLGVPWMMIGLAVAVVILIVVGGFFLLRGGSDAPDEPIETPGDTEVSQISGPNTPAEEPSRQEEAKPEKPVSGRESLLTGGPLADRAAVTASPAQKVETTLVKQEPVLIPALAGLPDQLVLDGRAWPVVLRLVCAEKREVSVKKDGDRLHSAVNWGETPLTATSRELTAGLGYRVSEGWAVYWGAEDHFSLKMEHADGVRATINGQYRDLGGLRAGQELILNDPAVIQSNLPPSRP